MTNSTTISDQGKGAALVVYVLYLLSIPSAGMLALAGVFVALICREGATDLWRRHLDQAIHIFGVFFLWSIVLLALSLVGWVLTFVLIGFVLLWMVGIAFFVLTLWFTVKSVLGLVALLDNRAP